MSPDNTSQKSELPDAQLPSRSGAPDYGTTVIDEQARSSAAATGGSVVELHAQGVQTKWKVRVHWGIIFAVVASVALWFLIRALVGLAF
jgi:hypothetical protein